MNIQEKLWTNRVFISVKYLKHECNQRNADSSGRICFQFLAIEVTPESDYPIRVNKYEIRIIPNKGKEWALHNFPDGLSQDVLTLMKKRIIQHIFLLPYDPSHRTLNQIENHRRFTTHLISYSKNKRTLNNPYVTIPQAQIMLVKASPIDSIKQVRQRYGVSINRSALEAQKQWILEMPERKLRLLAMAS